MVRQFSSDGKRGEVDYQAVGRFLSARFGTARPDLFVLVWQKQGDDKCSHWFRVGQLDKAAAFVAGVTSDVYAGCALSPGDFGPGKRCLAEQIAGIPGLWLDVDIKGPAHKADDLPGSVEEARPLLDCLGVPPTEVIHSGHGLQAWWLFDEPWIFASAAERNQAAELLRRFQGQLQQHAAARGWRLDPTHDLARVLRIPGTWNYKLPDEPVQVRVLEADGPRYTPGDFFALLEPEPEMVEPEPEAHHQHNGHAPDPVGDQGRILDRARAYVRKMPESVSGCRGHDAAFAVAQALVRGFDLGDEVAWGLLLEFNARCKPVWNEKELRHKLEQARTKSRLPFGFILSRSRARNGWTPPPPPNGQHVGGAEDGEPERTATDPEPPRLTDLGNGQRLARRHGRDLRYCHPWRKWLIWDKTHWRADDTGEATRRAKDTVVTFFRWATMQMERITKELEANANGQDS